MQNAVVQILRKCKTYFVPCILHCKRSITPFLKPLGKFENWTPTGIIFYNMEDLSYTWVIDLFRLLGSGHVVGSQWSVAAPAWRNRVSEVMIDFQLWKEVLLPGGRSSLSKRATGMRLRRRPRPWPLLIAAQSAGPTWSRISLVMESSEETRVWEWLHFVPVLLKTGKMAFVVYLGTFRNYEEKKLHHPLWLPGTTWQLASAQWQNFISKISKWGRMWRKGFSRQVRAYFLFHFLTIFGNVYSLKLTS